jgi:SAM-dependent methyltransferase
MEATCTWEEAVLWLRDQQDKQELVRFCFYDDPIEQAAARFYATEEWQATRELLRSKMPGRVLDVGAGRGIAAYAFAREGCPVVALEPDPSPVVGRGAIEELRAASGLNIELASGYGEGLPFENESFDIVYGRAVLHHARELPALLREVARVLRPGGLALFVREHVISRPEDLPAFLQGHALHFLYGGEHAYLLNEYRQAIAQAGLRLRQEMGPWDNPVNYWPATTAQARQLAQQKLAKQIGSWPAAALLRLPSVRAALLRMLSRRSQEPGRHFAFLGEKP